MTNEKEMLTIPELCHLLKVKESWLRHQIYMRKIPYYKIGRLIRFSKEDIRVWLERHPSLSRSQRR